ncbi:hypothetical protein SUGI_0285090 [Cryptomeria japonica]|nr:hypothetical protein SUGI_0285090 [Cryptomeria japonica]
MQKNQESEKEEFVDKPIAEDKSLYFMAKVDGDMNLNDENLFELESKFMEGEIGPSLPVKALDENDKTALHYAAHSHSHNCINLLLRNQGRIDIKSKEGQSPLDMALLSKRSLSSLIFGFTGS